jgi:oligoendopeptidase F
MYEAIATAAIEVGAEPEWLAEWSRLQEIVEEAATQAMIAYTCDTADPEKEAANLRWSSEIFPLVLEQHVRLSRRLVETGFTSADLETVLREFRADIAIFRTENLPLMSEVEELVARYQKVAGGLEVEWDGERRTVPQLQPFLKVRDRDVRERAFRSGAAAYMEQRSELAAVFDRMYTARESIARNAGFANFMEYAFAAKHRFDYTPDDCIRFHAAVERTVAPVVARLMEHRRQALGIDRVRPWDTQVQLETRDPIRPFATAEELVTPTLRIFEALDPELGAQFREMAAEGLLDLESRAGKAPGGYCTKLAWRGKPFIFMNAVGVPDDVNTLVHEAGHCFHDFAAHRQPFIWQRSTSHEAAELASMSMELLVVPHLAKPLGFYTPDQARAVEIEQLEDVLSSLVHIASVDAFQHWIYTSGHGHDAVARDNAWLSTRARFESGVDWSGLDAERVSRWYRQLHIFELPFYYIEYGLAQLGALQLWRDARRDAPAALARYKRFLALGGTRPLPELYAAAGVRLIFDDDGMRELVSLVDARLTELRAGS